MRPEVDLLVPRSRVHHLRNEGGRHEIDVLIDLGGGRVIAIEIKAGTTPTGRDAQHLTWLREEVGTRFVRGIVFNTGPQPFDLGDRIWALPIASLWAAHPTPRR